MNPSGKAISRVMLGQVGLAALAAGLAPAAASAQQLPDTATPQNQAPAQAAGPVTGVPAGADDAGVQDIVVTAERRESTIQRTPIAIAAVPGDQLTKAGITNARDLAQLIPSLELRQNTGSGAAIYIRGVGTENRTIGSDPSNVFTLDGVALNNRSGPDTLFFDVERVEVLKGPQGTLYGRNAVGGAVNLITRDPSLSAAGGYLIAGYGNYDAVKVEGAVNLPLNDVLALRVAGNLVKHDGYFDKGTFTQQGKPDKFAGDQNTRALRAKLLFEPSDAVRLVLNADYGRNTGRGPGYTVRGPTNNADAGGVFDPDNLRDRHIAGEARLDPCSDQVRNFVRSVTENPLQVGAQCTGFLDQKGWSAGANLKVDLGFANWTTLANIRRQDDNYRYFFRWDSVRTTGKSTERTVETRLASNAGAPLTWVAGFYYFNESGNQTDSSELNTATYAITLKPENHSKSLGLFAQATYPITEGLRLTGGIRYSHDKKSFDRLVQYTAGAEAAPPPATALAFNNAASFSKVNYRAVVEYDVAPRNLVYASLSSGYHAGGLAPGEAQGPYISRYDPETLTAYAVGTKNRFLDNRLQINAELFYWDYSNLLFSTRGFVNCSSCGAVPTGNPPTPAGAIIALVTYNAGKAYIYGADIDVVARITPSTTLSGNLYLNKSKYDNFVLSPFAGLGVNAAGNRLANVPATQATVALQQTASLAGAGKLVANVRYRYLGATWTGPSHNVPGSRLGGRNNVDLDLTYSPEGDRFSITGFVRNVFNVDYVLAGSGNGGDREPATGALWGTLTPPRTYGIQAQVRF